MIEKTKDCCKAEFIFIMFLKLQIYNLLNEGHDLMRLMDFFKSKQQKQCKSFLKKKNNSLWFHDGANGFFNIGLAASLALRSWENSRENKISKQKNVDKRIERGNNWMNISRPKLRPRECAIQLWLHLKVATIAPFLQLNIFKVRH